jgi:F-type H+-transporting ATPase subunit b
MFVTPAYAASETAASSGEMHTGTETPHGGGHESNFPPFDPSTFPSQLLWLAITFGLFYLFLKNTALPRIGGILEFRRDRIAQDIDQAARMKEETDAAIAAYEQELADARAKAHEIAQAARDEAKADADAERGEIEKGLEQKMADAEKRIASIKNAALKEVGTIAEDTASSIVGELIGCRVAKNEISAAVKAAGG